MITLRGVTKRFGDQLVLDGLDLDLPESGVTVVTGPNGSGKTTLGRLLLGLEVADVGVVDGLQGRRCAAVFQEDRLCEQVTAVGNVRLVLPRTVGSSAVVEGLRAVGLADECLDKPVRELSGGQRRKVALVRALMAQADVVVLDEPFTGLDVESKPMAMAWVRARCAGRVTVLITHDADEAAFFGPVTVRLALPPLGQPRSHGSPPGSTRSRIESSAVRRSWT